MVEKDARLMVPTEINEWKLEASPERGVAGHGHGGCWDVAKGARLGEQGDDGGWIGKEDGLSRVFFSLG